MPRTGRAGKYTRSFPGTTPGEIPPHVGGGPGGVPDPRCGGSRWNRSPGSEESGQRRGTHGQPGLAYPPRSPIARRGKRGCGSKRSTFTSSGAAVPVRRARTASPTPPHGQAEKARRRRRSALHLRPPNHHRSSPSRDLLGLRDRRRRWNPRTVQPSCFSTRPGRSWCTSPSSHRDHWSSCGRLNIDSLGRWSSQPGRSTADRPGAAPATAAAMVRVGATGLEGQAVTTVSPDRSRY